MTLSESLQEQVEAYRAMGGPWPATAPEMAEWLIVARGVRLPRSKEITVLAELLSKALREEYYTDPQGRRVRTKHAAKKKVGGKQLTFWDDIRSATPAHMAVAFQQRREGIVHDCRQLKTDVDSYNENARPPRPISLVLDFEADVAELETLDPKNLAAERRLDTQTEEAEVDHEESECDEVATV